MDSKCSINKNSEETEIFQKVEPYYAANGVKNYINIQFLHISISS